MNSPFSVEDILVVEYNSFLYLDESKYFLDFREAKDFRGRGKGTGFSTHFEDTVKRCSNCILDMF